jgi:hypothetical protein
LEVSTVFWCAQDSGEVVGCVSLSTRLNEDVRGSQDTHDANLPMIRSVSFYP